MPARRQRQIGFFAKIRGVSRVGGQDFRQYLAYIPLPIMIITLQSLSGLSRKLYQISRNIAPSVHQARPHVVLDDRRLGEHRVGGNRHRRSIRGVD